MPSRESPPHRASPRPARLSLRKVILGAGVVAVGVLWAFRGPLRRQIAAREVLANDAPDAAAVQECLDTAADPAAFILELWNTGKVVHRELAVRELPRVAARGQRLPPPLEALALAAALDPDLKVREEALSCLAAQSDPALPAMAAAQLKDCDPQVRLLGLRYLQGVPPGVGVPAVLPLLDDDDPQVAAMTVNLLGRWSGANFGLKLADAVPVDDPKTGLKEYEPGSRAKVRAGVARAKSWWHQHRAESRPSSLRVPASARAALQPVRAGGFRLPDLAGRAVRLSDFRGRVVLINFWTTWCTACVEDMPALIALARRSDNRFVILGVSLDAVPEQAGRQAAASIEAVRRKIVGTVKRRGLNYPVLWDRTDRLGARFNGGELPTTVIIDAGGRVRRRFIGARRLSVLQAMLAEAERPAQNGG
jgi:thiol-disulfide isomerase/thioredoxin